MPHFRRIPQEGGANDEFIQMADTSLIKLSREGLKILGCPMGTDTFCANTLARTALKIEADLQALAVFPHLHQRIKMATFCTNTRPTYFLRAAKLRISVPIMSELDGSFDQFLASTLSFESGYAVSEHGAAYLLALLQARLGIKQGGMGMTSNKMVAPAALYTALGWFHRWLTKGHANLLSMQWLQVHSANNQASFSYVQNNMADALQMLETDWQITSSSDGDALHLPSEGLACIPDAAGFLLAEQKGIPRQHTITEFMKMHTRRSFFADLSPDNKHRLNQVSLSQVPARHASSDIAPPRHHAHDTLRQVPMALWALTCHYELSDQAVLVSLAISLGTPVPHARYLKEHVTDYADADVWGDSLLNKAENGSTSWKATHDQIAAELASIATGGGVPATAVERKIPYLDATTRRRGDLMTTVGGLIPFVGRPAYNKHTRLIMDVRLGHTFTTANHVCKPKCIATMETEKRTKYSTGYRDKGYAFAPMVANSWGVCGPDLIRFLWAIADHAARHHLSMPDADLRVLPQQLWGPQSASQTAAADSQISAFKALRGSLNVEYRQRVLTAVYEATTERLYGRTYALSSFKCYRETLAHGRAVWQPVFHVLPCDGPSAAASEGSSMLPSNSSVASDSLPPA